MNTKFTRLFALASASLLLNVAATGQIIFQDASEQSAAAPFHHGGTNSSVNGSFTYIGGGLDNSVYDDYSVVGGGSANEAGSDDNTDNNDSHSTVIGGSFNTTSGFYSVIAGGYINDINADWGLIGGGYLNSVNADYSAVAGGSSNTTSALYSAVLGGSNNSADGIYGFIAGTGATDSNNSYSFVWGGKTGARTSAGSDTFNVWSANGIYLNGSVKHSSDRNLKEYFKDVDSRDVLARLLKLPVTEWRFKEEDESMMHIGPMAQDFKKAFDLGGNDDRHIATTDADGVVLAAIQGLNEVLNEKQAELDALITLVETYEERLNQLEIARQSAQGGVQ